MAATRVLTLHELNRTTLSRQLLLERSALSVSEAVERLVGMQAQLASAPFVGLWTRLQPFGRDDLAGRIADRSIIKATLMRATLHLFTAADYLLLRGAIQPALTSAAESIAKTREAGVFDREEVLAAARQFLSEAPHSYAELSAMLEALKPAVDPGAMRYTVRTYLPMVQVPTDTQWSYPGNAVWTLADAWLGRDIPMEDHFKTLVFRYLAAFGPATIKDFETWSYVPRAKEAFEALRPELVTYRDEGKRELFDLPDLPILDGDTPAPPRFLPEFDNILLSHDKRTRILADAYRKQVYLPGLRVAATILVDGFVAGAWKVEVKKKAAALTITPFAPLDPPTIRALTDEAERLVRFVEPDAKGYEVAVASSG